MAIAISAVFSIASLFFGVAFLINWISYHEETSAFRRVGLGVGVIYLVISVPLILVSLNLPASAESSTSTIAAIVITPINFFKLYLTVTLGCYYSAQLGHPVFPLVRRRQRVTMSNANSADSQDPGLASVAIFATDTELSDAPSPIESATDPQLHTTVEQVVETWQTKLKLRTYVLSVVGVVVGAIIFSYVLFLVTSPQSLGHSGKVTTQVLAVAVLAALEFALVEEITFRLGVQSFLAKVLRWQGSKYWLTVLVSSTFWTMGHVNMMEPYWVKLVQVFPMGLALGWLNRKFGTESSILAHCLFNLAMVFLTV